MRTLWKDPERFKKSYFPEEYGGKYYLAGDSALKDADGYIWIMGRIDDVLKHLVIVWELWKLLAVCFGRQ